MRQVRRKQAIDAYPFLLQLYCLDTRGRWRAKRSPGAAGTDPVVMRLTQSAKQLRHAIDYGVPLASLLPRTLGLEPWMVEHLRRYGSALGVNEWGRNSGKEGDIAAQLAIWTPETAPRTLQLMQRTHQVLFCRHGDLSPLYLELEAAISSADRQALQRILNEKAHDNFEQYLRFIDQARKWVSAWGAPASDHLTDLVGTNSVAHWLELCGRWHQINRRLQQSYLGVGSPEDLSVPVEWPPLINEAITVGPYRFNSLSSLADLNAEGQRMVNCVPIYVVQCAVGRTHLLHVSVNGKPIATLQVEPGEPGSRHTLTLVHAEGPARADLPEEVSQALKTFLDGLNDGTFAVNPLALPDATVRAARLRSVLQLQCTDYPTWAAAGLAREYFDSTALTSGAAIFKSYRTALAFRPGHGSLYSKGLEAVREFRGAHVRSRDTFWRRVSAR